MKEPSFWQIRAGSTSITGWSFRRNESNAESIGKGYPFPMLAKKLSPFTPTTKETLILPNLRKRKTLQSSKITTLPKIHIQFCGTFSFVLFFDFRYLFCGGCHNPKPRIAYPVEQRVKLPTLRVLFSGLV